MAYEDIDRAFEEFREIVTEYLDGDIDEDDEDEAEHLHALCRAIGSLREGCFDDVDDGELFELWDALGLHQSRTPMLEKLYQMLDGMKLLREYWEHRNNARPPKKSNGDKNG